MKSQKAKDVTLKASQSTKSFFPKKDKDSLLQGDFFGRNKFLPPQAQRKSSEDFPDEFDAGSTIKASTSFTHDFNFSQIPLFAPGSHAAENQAEHEGSQIGAKLDGVVGVSEGLIPDAIRNVAEQHLGVSLVGARLATDGRAQIKTDQHKAKAVAEGSTISFDKKYFETSSSKGKTLLGHELTHVAQQRRAGVSLPQCVPDPTKQITRDEFKAHLAGKSLSVSSLLADLRLKGANINAADTDKDGKISTQDEFSELFTQLDNLDSDGNKDTMASRDANGSGNKVTVALAAIGDTAGVTALTKPLQDAIDSRGFTDEIGHIATRKVNTLEVAALRGTGVKVTQIRDPKDKEKLKVGKTTYDFSVDADRKAFVATLGLSPGMSATLVDAIKNGPTDGRSELAQIIRMWAPAERGETIPSRLVLSGHSVGGGDVWGDQGSVDRKDIAAIAAAMPNAAKLIEDIHVAACYCGGQSDVMAWQGIFPKLKTVWAYTGSGPTSTGGAPNHLVKWQTQTRGRKKDFKRSSISSKDSAAWTIDGGYKSSSPTIPLADARKKVTDGEPVFKAHFDGTSVVTSTSSGPLRSYYIDLQNLLQHPSLPQVDRPALALRRDTTILLIYYAKSVAKRFNQANSAGIDSGYKALSLSVPDFGALSRADGLASINAFNKALKAANPKPKAAKDLDPILKSLADLDPAKIPSSWI